MKLKFRFFMSVMLIFTFQHVQSQAPEWSRLIQATTYGSVNANLLAGDDDHVIMAGSISGPVTFDGLNLTSVCLRDLIIVKMNSTGTREWLKQYNSWPGGINPKTIRMDQDGNIFVAVQFTGTLVLDGYTLTDANGALAKMDADGNILWATSFPTTGTGKWQMNWDGGGNCYLINPNKLMKFSPSGEFLWEMSIPFGTMLTLALQGNDLYVGGYLMPGTSTFGSITKTVNFRTGFLVKGDPDGFFTDSLFISGSPENTGSWVNDLKINADGDLIMAGGYARNLILGSVSILNDNSSRYAFIAKCNSSFSVLWARSDHGSMTTNTNIQNYLLYFDGLSNIYLSGMTPGGFGFESLYVNPGNFILKLETDGLSPEFINLYTTAAVLVTPSGKIVHSGTYGLEDAVLYNNFFIKQISWDWSVDWQKISVNNQTGGVRINYVDQDEQGNIYSSARITGYCNYFGTIVNTNITKTVISKHDNEGNIQWSQAVTDLVPSLSYPFGPMFSLDKENNILTAGKFSILLSAGSFTLANENLSDDGYIVKYSSDGEILWAVQLHSGNSCNIHGVVPDKEGNVIVSGEFNSWMRIAGVTLDAGGIDGMFVLKLDKNGNLLWARGYPIGNVVYLAMPGTDGNGNIYVACEMYNRVTQVITIGDASTPQTSSDGGTVLVKFDLNGNPQWVHTYGGAPLPIGDSNGWPTDIKTDNDGNCYLWGWCSDHAVFGSTTLTNSFKPVSTNWFYYLTKINNSGEVVWANAVSEKNYSFNYGDMLDLDEEGNIYAGGHFKDSIEVAGNMFKPQGSNDFFMIKFTNDGDYEWIKTMASNGTNINSLSVLKENSVTISGLAGINSTLGPFTILRKGGSTSIIATMGDLLTHFVPVWSGNGTDQMNINVYSALLDGLNLDTGDEIALFDGELCVGVGIVNGPVTTGNVLQILASADEGSVNGYTPGDSILYKIYDRSADKEITLIAVLYNTASPSWSSDGKYLGGATAFVALTGYSTVDQQLSLITGWNLFSLNNMPQNPDMKALFQPLIDEGKLVKIQDETGSALEDMGLFGGWVNNIGDLKLTEGYKIKVTSKCQPLFSGIPAALPFDIPLHTGWNICGFPTQTEADGMAVVQQLITRGKLIKVQDEKGMSIEDYGIFGGWVNNIGNFKPGKGYKFKVTTNETLTIYDAYPKSSTSPLSPASPVHFKTLAVGNGVDHMNINLVGIPEGLLKEGDEIGIFDGDLCMGARVIGNQYSVIGQDKSQITNPTIPIRNPKSEIRNLSIPVTASDDSGLPGFTEGHPYTIKIWKSSTNREYTAHPVILKGSSTFLKHESALISLENLTIGRSDDLLIENLTGIHIYPNPTDGKIHISSNEFPVLGVIVTVTNAIGQQIMTKQILTNPGVIDLSGNTPGIYYLTITSHSSIKTEKIMLR